MASEAELKAAGEKYIPEGLRPQTLQAPTLPAARPGRRRWSRSSRRPSPPSARPSSSASTTTSTSTRTPPTATSNGSPTGCGRSSRGSTLRSAKCRPRRPGDLQGQPIQARTHRRAWRGRAGRVRQRLTAPPMITVYQQDTFIDLCRGPHVETTADLDPKGFKITQVTGSYRRGDSRTRC